MEREALIAQLQIRFDMMKAQGMPEDVAVNGVSWRQFKEEFIEKIRTVPAEELGQLMQSLSASERQYGDALRGVKPAPQAPATPAQTEPVQTPPAQTAPVQSPPAQTAPPSARQAEFNANAANLPAQREFTDNRDLLRRQAPQNPDRAELHITNPDYGNRLDLIAVAEMREGQIRVQGTGDPGHEDPGAGMSFSFDPRTNKLTVVNSLLVAENGAVVERNPPLRQEYSLNFAAAANADAPAHVMNDPRGPFERVRELSESGNLEVRALKAQDSFTEGNISIIYKDPATGTTTTLYIDEDTVVVDRTGGDGQTTRAEQQLDFPDQGFHRDFRYQPPQEPESGRQIGQAHSAATPTLA